MYRHRSHSYKLPEHGSSKAVFHVTKHTGQMSVVLSYDQAPVKLVKPFTDMGIDMVEYGMQACQGAPRTTLYIGVRGYGHCASYEISVFLLASGAECTEPAHYIDFATSLQQESSGIQLRSLTAGVLQAGSCRAHEWAFLRLLVTPDQQTNNMVFELEDENKLRLDALAIYMYPTEVPESLESELQVSSTLSGIYSLSASMHDFGLFETEVQQWCGVRGSTGAVRGSWRVDLARRNSAH